MSAVMDELFEKVDELYGFVKQIAERMATK